jgi:hypothetical protein
MSVESALAFIASIESSARESYAIRRECRFQHVKRIVITALEALESPAGSAEHSWDPVHVLTRAQRYIEALQDAPSDAEAIDGLRSVIHRIHGLPDDERTASMLRVCDNLMDLVSREMPQHVEREVAVPTRGECIATVSNIAYDPNRQCCMIELTCTDERRRLEAREVVAQLGRLPYIGQQLSIAVDGERTLVYSGHRRPRHEHALAG